MRTVLAVVAVLSTHCGGNVVFDQGGSGEGAQGSGAQGSGTGPIGEGANGPASSSGTGPIGVIGCDELWATYEKAVSAAVVCNPTISSPQCDGSVVGRDNCGCPNILLNEKDPALAAAALGAYDDWVAAQCGPFDCDQPCAPAQSGGCIPTNGNGGICGVFGPD